MASSFLSNTPGLGGRIGEGNEFKVNEIDSRGEILSIENPVPSKGTGSHGHFIIEKLNWTTIDLVHSYAKQLRVKSTSFGVAGNKDRRALTTQLLSAERIYSLPLVKDVRSVFIGNGNRIGMGDLAGNYFSIKMNHALKKEDAMHRVNAILEELGAKVPNYFGSQRFGSLRSNTARIGELMVKGDFENAVEEYLTVVGEEESTESKEARERLAKEHDYLKALEYFPRYLRYERMLLESLARSPRDPVNALRRLPRSLSLMFVHAFQSELFNEMLSMRVQSHFAPLEHDEYCGKNVFGFEDEAVKGDSTLLQRIIGYDVLPKNDMEQEVLENHNVIPEDFRIPSLPELNAKGTQRPAWVTLRDFSFKDDWASFSLPKGSYATSALREFIEENKGSSKLNNK